MFIRLFLCIVLASTLLSCKSKQERRCFDKKIVIGVQNNCFSALVLIAKEQGYFDQEGVEVELAFYPSGKLAHNALLRGEVDLCTVADMPIAAGGVRDSSTVVAVIGKSGKEKRVSARVDHGIESAADLKGKRIGTQENSSVHFFLSVLLTETLIPEDSCTIVFMDAVDLPVALEEGTIDAFAMRNPYSRMVKESLGDTIIELYSGFYLAHFLLAKKTGSEHPCENSTKAVLRALLQSEELCRAEPQRAIEAISMALPGDRRSEVMHDYFDYTFSISLDKVLLLTLEKQYSWKYPSHTAVPDFTERLNPHYLRAVAPNTVTVRGE